MPISMPEVRESTAGELMAVDRVAMPLSHVHDMRNQKLFSKLSAPPVLNNRHSHSCPRMPMFWMACVSLCCSCSASVRHVSLVVFASAVQPSMLSSTKETPSCSTIICFETDE